MCVCIYVCVCVHSSLPGLAAKGPFPCWPGTFCIAGSTKPTDCPSGTLSKRYRNEKAEDCDQCTEGRGGGIKWELTCVLQHCVCCSVVFVRVFMCVRSWVSWVLGVMLMLNLSFLFFPTHTHTLSLSLSHTHTHTHAHTHPPLYPPKVPTADPLDSSILTVSATPTTSASGDRRHPTRPPGPLSC